MTPYCKSFMESMADGPETFGGNWNFRLRHRAFLDLEEHALDEFHYRVNIYWCPHESVNEVHI